MSYYQEPSGESERRNERSAFKPNSGSLQSAKVTYNPLSTTKSNSFDFMRQIRERGWERRYGGHFVLCLRWNWDEVFVYCWRGYNATLSDWSMWKISECHIAGRGCRMDRVVRTIEYLNSGTKRLFVYYYFVSQSRREGLVMPAYSFHNIHVLNGLWR